MEKPDLPSSRSGDMEPETDKMECESRSDLDGELYDGDDKTSRYKPSEDNTVHWMEPTLDNMAAGKREGNSSSPIAYLLNPRHPHEGLRVRYGEQSSSEGQSYKGPSTTVPVPVEDQARVYVNRY